MSETRKTQKPGKTRKESQLNLIFVVLSIETQKNTEFYGRHRKSRREVHTRSHVHAWEWNDGGRFFCLRYLHKKERIQVHPL